MMAYAMHSMLNLSKKACFEATVIDRYVIKLTTLLHYFVLVCRHNDDWSDSHLEQSTIKEQLNRPIQSRTWTIVIRES